MWTRRRTFRTRELPASNHPATLTTPRFTRQHNVRGHIDPELTLAEEDFNFTSSLGYTVVPHLEVEEARALLPWVLARWLPKGEAGKDALRRIGSDDLLLKAFSQIEYFLCGTDNGQVFAIPLLPMHFVRPLSRLMAPQSGEEGSEGEGGGAGTLNEGSGGVPLLQGLARELANAKAQRGDASTMANCGPRRLLHRHAREEPVLSVDHLGTIVASAASADRTVCVSVFHPTPRGLALLPHPGPVRCVKLWEGNCFTNRPCSMKATTTTTTTGASDQDGALQLQLLRQWHQTLMASEASAVYVFTGDEAATVRMWRVDVCTGTTKAAFTLLHVLVISNCSSGGSGTTSFYSSSLQPLAREDNTRRAVELESAQAVHCMALDGDARLVAGTEGGLVVWCLDKLSWRTADTCAAQHPLAWCEEGNHPLLLRHATAASASETMEHQQIQRDNGEEEEEEKKIDAAATARLALLRTKRLVNRHVWVRETSFVQRVLTEQDQRRRHSETFETVEAGAPAGDGSSDPQNWPAAATPVGSPEISESGGDKKKLFASKWRQKYADNVTGGLAVGVVSNEVLLPALPKRTRQQGEEQQQEQQEEVKRVADVLDRAIVTLTFDNGLLRNEMRVPASCVEPVVYPMRWLRMPGVACFAVQALQGDSERDGSKGSRVISSGSDGKVCVWMWTRKSSGERKDGDANDGLHGGDEDDFTYVPMLAAGANRPQRGLGRQLCVLRSPDIFLSCGYDESLVKEWHVYDDSPELLLRCERRFSLMPVNMYDKAAGRMVTSSSGTGMDGNNLREMSDAIREMAKSKEQQEKDNESDGSDSDTDDGGENAGRWRGEDDLVAGVSCAVAYPAFGALFLVGVFENAIQAFSLSEVQGCQPPRDYIYNGFKTVKLPSALREEAYYRAGVRVEEPPAE